MLYLSTLSCPVLCLIYFSTEIGHLPSTLILIPLIIYIPYLISLVTYWFLIIYFNRCGNTSLFGCSFDIVPVYVPPQIVPCDSAPYTHYFLYIHSFRGVWYHYYMELTDTHYSDVINISSILSSSSICPTFFLQIRNVTCDA